METISVGIFFFNFFDTFFMIDLSLSKALPNVDLKKISAPLLLSYVPQLTTVNL